MKAYTPPKTPLVGLTLTLTTGQQVVIVRECGRLRDRERIFDNRLYSFWVAPVYGDGSLGQVQAVSFYGWELNKALEQVKPSEPTIIARRYTFGDTPHVTFEPGGPLYGFVPVETSIPHSIFTALLAAAGLTLAHGPVVGTVANGAYALVADVKEGAPFAVEILRK